MTKRELVLLKLGGSLITHKDRPFTPDMKTIERLAREIRNARKERDFDLILGHGGGSFPHFPAKKYQTHKGMIHKKSPRGFAETQDAAARLNRLVVTALLNAGENAVSVSPSSCSISKHGAISHFFYLQIRLMLKHGLLPVVYGDPVMDTHRGCSILSTEARRRGRNRRRHDSREHTPNPHRQKARSHPNPLAAMTPNL
ncbi:MAG: isopentenyl phosphate kinase [Candidatus Micrarchaeota archaeon]|nr:isopentenyl phosphate kinase [Candidatus Micrarchaeota archaeon]